MILPTTISERPSELDRGYFTLIFHAIYLYYFGTSHDLYASLIMESKKPLVVDAVL